jgi:hypothetical protein
MNKANYKKHETHFKETSSPINKARWEIGIYSFPNAAPISTADEQTSMTWFSPPRVESLPAGSEMVSLGPCQYCASVLFRVTEQSFLGGVLREAACMRCNTIRREIA